jgi:hypothetical protein
VGKVRTSREIYVTAGKVPEIVDQAEQALIEGEAEIYQRGEMLVRVVSLDANEGADGVRRDSELGLFTGRFLPTLSAPGDKVVFRAKMSVIAVISACPQDMSAINGPEGQIRDLEFEVN